MSAKNVSQLKPLLLLGLIVALTTGTGLVTLSILDGIPRMAFWFVFLLATLMAGLAPFVGLLALGLAVFGSQTSLWMRSEMSVAILGCMLTLLLEKQAWARFLDAEAALFEPEIERLTFTVPYDAPETVTDPAFLREFQIFPKMVEAMVGVIRGRTFWARLDGKMIQAKSQHPIQVPFLRFSESLNAWAFGVLFESAHVVFLPDRMLYFNGTNQSAPYSSLRLTIVPVLYESTGSPPEDAWLIRRFWRHVRKDGMPDERYSDNPAFYQIQLACLKVQAPGLAVELLFTDWESVRRLEATLSGVIPVQIQFPVPEQEKKESREQRKPRPEPPPAKNPDRFLTACRILQVTPAMAWEEVRSAYKKAVRENHPDMLAGMSERLREQANQFLGEINKAFAYLEGVRDRFSS